MHLALLPGLTAQAGRLPPPQWRVPWPPQWDQRSIRFGHRNRKVTSMSKNNHCLQINHNTSPGLEIHGPCKWHTVDSRPVFRRCVRSCLEQRLPWKRAEKKLGGMGRISNRHMAKLEQDIIRVEGPIILPLIVRSWGVRLRDHHGGGSKLKGRFMV